ncbi:MAG: ABC transporter ATP-binding protein/permease [Acidithiobacillus sp.]|uniref:ABC transporter ATP-binding protein/permease n=1 Tax=Acidithiobacillus sp. TaxID=1872118 RepID=UPI003D073464
MQQFNRAFFRDLWQLTKPYWWRSEERWLARGLFALVVLLNLLMVFISYRITEWYNTFWNALQRYDAPAAWHQILIFAILVTPYIIAAVYQTYLTQMLEIRWRRWLTEHYLDAWLAKGTFYHMQVLGDGTDNPDQRISEDLASFTSQTLNLVIGVLSSITTLAAFVFMLWELSSHVIIPWDGQQWIIPGYLVWAALLYAILGTVLTAWIGRPLINLNFNQERFQADFRFSLVRLRENSESVALYGGETQEREHFLNRFASVFGNFWQIMKRTKRLNWWVSGYGQAAIIFPVLVSLPAYFAKAIPLGTIMQISSAFGQVQGALSFIVNSYTGLASWHAVVDRLRFFEQAMHEVQVIRETHYQITREDGPHLAVRHLNVRLPDGRELIHDLDFTLERGQRLLIMGPSGGGKSTLVRALAGIWPFGEGVVQMPRNDRPLFLPQKPYLPLGTLRDVLVYPFGVPGVSDESLRGVLLLCGMPSLAERLDEARLWAHVLSLGEQQRLAFARILLQKPQWVFMDEATSALDEPAEGRLYEMLIEELPQTAIISVGHRSSLLQYHEQRLALLGEGRWRLGPVTLPGASPLQPQPA